jgi:hypothetical protein
MISVIICSVNKQRLSVVSKNISETIGVEHEIIGYDNTKNSLGICSVYNLCAEKSKYDFLCFVHEDIRFVTQNWGNELIGNTNSDTGFIGLAGGVSKSAYPTSWGDTLPEFVRLNVIQCINGEKKADYRNPLNERYAEVLVLDGVFLFTRKEVWKTCQFDPVTFDAFHLYDQDISLNAHLNGYKNFVCFTIQLEHDSVGSFSEKWYQYSLLFCKKWADNLPCSLIPLSEKERKREDLFALYFLLKYYLIKNNLPNREIYPYLGIFLKRYFFTDKCLTILSKFVVKQFR